LFSNTPLASNSFEPAWSPDGKTIVIPVAQPRRHDFRLESIDVSTGKHQTSAFSAERLYFGGVWLRMHGPGDVTVSQMTACTHS